MIINIRGTNGTGKSTVVREFLYPLHEPFGSPTILASGPYPSPTKKDPERMLPGHVYGTATQYGGIALGTYKNNCGGCDEYTWKGAHDTLCDAIRTGAAVFRNVFFEGITVSSVYKRYVALAEQCFQESGQRTYWINLLVPIEECLERIHKRSGREVTDRMIGNVTRKWEVVESCHKSALELNSSSLVSMEFYRTEDAIDYVKELLEDDKDWQENYADGSHP